MSSRRMTKKYKAELLQKLLEVKKKELILLEWAKRYRDANKIEFVDKAPNPGLNPKQAELFEAWINPDYKVFTLTGSNRLGKTVSGVWLALSTMFGQIPWSKQSLLPLIQHNQPRKVRYVGQDWEKHIKMVVIPELEKWWPESRRRIKSPKNNQGIETLWIDSKTKSSLEIMSNLQDSDLHEGWQGDLVIYDEPPKREIRIANARGLVDRRGRELFVMTLLKEAWVDREVIKARLEDGRPDPQVYNVHGTIYDNVGFGLTQEGVEDFAKKLTDDEKQARLLGIPSYMSGLVYPTFNRKIHLKKRFKIPLDWPVDIAIDVHPREKQAILFIAYAPNGNKYICNEFWDNGDGTAVGEELVRKVHQNLYRVNRIIIDPLSKGDKNNESTVFQKIGNVLYRYEFPLEVASKDKDAGILSVKEHLLGPNKEPSLLFFDDCIRTLYEIEGYMWDKETQKPMDKDDHMMENLYRICLLNTSYYSFEEETQEDEYYDTGSGKSKVGGY